MIFTTAASDNVESIYNVAFENVELGILLIQYFSLNAELLRYY